MNGPHKTPRGKLTEAGVLAAYRLRAEGATYDKIAEELGITRGTAYLVCSGRTWGWLYERHHKGAA